MGKHFFTIAILIFSASTRSFAQVTASASTQVEMVTPITIARTADLDFGMLATTPGVVTMGYTNNRVAYGGAAFGTGGAAPTTAQFLVTGDGNNSFTVAVTHEITLTGSQHGSLKLTEISADSEIVTALVNGKKTINIGGQLTITANTLGGLYINTCDLAVTIYYN